MTRMLRAFHNDLAEAAIKQHEVVSIHAKCDGVSVLECSCDATFQTTADRDEAVERLWRTHAVHLSAQLVQVGAGR